MRRFVSMPLAALACLVFALLTPSSPAQAMKIQKVVSPGGIEAWLVEEKAIPLIAMHFAFVGGSVQDPAEKGGLSHFLSAMLDEGAGEFNAEKFHERMEEYSVKMSFEASRDHFAGTFETLSVNRDQAFELLRLALNKPLFADEAVARIKNQLLASLAFNERDPDRVASRAWFDIAFPKHPYGRPVEGTKETIATIARADLERYRGNVFARDTLKVAVVGDIDAKTLATLLDRVFGELQPKARLQPVALAEPPAGPKEKRIEMDVPQSAARFGLAAFMRKDPDFIPSFVLNYILGGGGFSSRLMEEVREKRGLAYGVYSSVLPLRSGAIYIGNVATKAESISESISVIRAQLKRMAEEGVTDVELKNAKSYLTGSYPLGFDTNSKIAGQLLFVQTEELGMDYFERRNKLIEAVGIADLRRVAKRLLKSDALIITIVGRLDQKQAPANQKKPPG
ncbi:MAG: insulinase family protein [Hyphomicrobiaceae bacterium]|nr:MAG: insulinase family protein [Hyphomicrobiaceae bacterium]